MRLARAGGRQPIKEGGQFMHRISWLIRYLFLNHQHPANPRNIHLVAILYVGDQSVLPSISMTFDGVSMTDLRGRLRIDHDTRFTDQAKITDNQTFACCFLCEVMQCQWPGFCLARSSRRREPHSEPPCSPRWCTPDHRRSRQPRTGRERSRDRYSIYP